MKKQKKFILSVISILVVAIALLAFTKSNVANDDQAQQSELVIEKGAKTDFNATTSYDGCGDGKCGDGDDKKGKKKDKKAKKEGDKCGEGKCGEGKCGDGKEKKKEKEAESEGEAEAEAETEAETETEE